MKLPSLPRLNLFRPSLLSVLIAAALVAAPSARAACDGAPLIVLTKSASKSNAAPSETISVTYQVDNISGMPLTGIVVVDDSGTPDFPADDVVNTIPFMGVGETIVYSVTTTVPGTAGTYTSTAFASTTLFGFLPVASSASTVVTVENPPPPPPTNPGVLGQGYWKNHPAGWPLATIQLGAHTYSAAEALALLLTPPKKGDKSMSLVHQLIAARLNVAAGNDASCVQAAIDDAGEFLTLFPVGQNVSASSPAWKAVAPVFEILDAYNNGELCVLARVSAD